jgi:hypothetical protein
MSEFILFGTPLSKALVLLNAAICSVIVIRILTYRRNGSTHRQWAGWVAWLLAVLFGYCPIQLLFGHLVIVEPTQIGINFILMCALLKLKGNVVQLFKTVSGTR